MEKFPRVENNKNYSFSNLDCTIVLESKRRQTTNYWPNGSRHFPNL